MELTPTNTTIETPQFGESLIEYVRTNRGTAGNILAGISVILLILTAYLAYRAFQTTPGSSDKTAEKAKDEKDKALDLANPKPKESATGVNLKQGDYNVGWISSLLAFIVVGLGTTWLLASPPPLTVDRQRSEIREAILIIGGLVGIVIILAGLVYFYRWSESLSDWLDKDQQSEARWTVISLMMAVVGSGLVFLAIQPARAEERNNSLVRKLVYGANFALTGMLLLVALVVLNVLFSLKVPNKLDTTATGFYSLSDNTRQLLQRLDQTVTAYAFLDQDENQPYTINDIRQLLLSCQDASNGKFKVKFISQISDRSEYLSLRSKYPQLGIVLDQPNVSAAILLTAGEGEKRHVVVSDRDLIEGGRNPTFVGEPRLYKEIAFLADNQIKPVIYFTQSNREMDITGTREQGPEYSLTRLKAYLEKNYLDVRPLELPLDNAVVPDDAAVVVVAEPRTPYSPSALAALRKYMENPAKKGKIVFLSGAVAGVGDKMLKTGIEPLLSDFNISLSNQFLYSFPNPNAPPQRELSRVQVQFSLWAGNNPVIASIARVLAGFYMVYPRVVEKVTTNPNPAFQAEVLLYETEELTWLEDTRLVDPIKTSQELLKKLMSGKSKDTTVSQKPRPVALAVSEGSTGRVVAFGGSVFISDAAARGYPEDTSLPTFDLFGVTLDWLRDRNTSIAASGIEAKKYTTYSFPPVATVDGTRLIWLPLGLGLLSVIGLGAGVWVIRRK